MLRLIFGTERKEATGTFGKLHNGELHILYPSPNVRMTRSRTVRLVGRVTLTVETCMLCWVENSKEMRPLGRHRGRTEDNM